MTGDFIHDFWENQGTIHKDSHWASWGDRAAVHLEIDLISTYIKPSHIVADIGCGNGYSTEIIYTNTKPRSLIGIDFSSTLIRSASERVSTLTNPSLTFRVGDARNLPLPEAAFDVVYTTRMLINLPSWQQQIIAINECLRIAKPGGILILSEAFWEPFCALNALRAICGLVPLREHDYNRYIKLSVLREHLENKQLSYEIDNFSSVYYFGSRLLREIVEPKREYEGYSHPINQVFETLEKEYSGGPVGVQQAVIIHK